DKDGAYIIESIFKEHITKPVTFSSNGRIRSHFGALHIKGITVEIMGDIEKFVEGRWEETPDLNDITRIVILENIHIPILKLDYEAEAYRKLGRTEKASLLNSYIRSFTKKGASE